MAWEGCRFRQVMDVIFKERADSAKSRGGPLNCDFQIRRINPTALHERPDPPDNHWRISA